MQEWKQNNFDWGLDLLSPYYRPEYWTTWWVFGWRECGVCRDQHTWPSGIALVAPPREVMGSNLPIKLITFPRGVRNPSR